MTTKSQDNDARIIEHIRQRLDEDVEALDDATLSRLRQARRLALAAASQPNRPWWGKIWPGSRPAGDWLVPAGAFASVFATALALTLMVAEPDNGLVRAVDDLELFTVGEDLELYENLEFYQWLEDREQAG